jgi:competence protein ComEA
LHRIRGARVAMVAAREKGSEAMLIKGLSAALVAATLLAPIAIAGPVDVNSADAKTLARELQGIGMSKAQAIISYREKNGPFKGVEDLAKVKGLGKKLVDQNKPNLRFEVAKAGG